LSSPYNTPSICMWDGPRMARKFHNSQLATSTMRFHPGRGLYNRNFRGTRNVHQNRAMRIPSRPAILTLVCGLALCVSWGQQEPRQASSARQQGPNGDHGRSDRTLSQDDGLSVIAAALDPKVRRYSGGDCSHLVHAIYERAGFPYAYASSSDLYAGLEGFQRVTQPQPGDLVVWRGHVGIVIRPSRHVFFSFLRGGPGINDYQAPYWTRRGRPRFYRYVKNDPCAGCAHFRQSN
jgi:hypothetical protein